MTRKKHMRAVKVKLDCGHINYIYTSFYRLTKERAFLIADRNQIFFCEECDDNIPKYIVEVLGTERWD